MRTKAILLIGAIGVLLTLFGCATNQTKPQFNILVDSLASIGAESKKNYVLLPGNEGVTLDDLQFQEFATYLIRVLSSKGYVLVDSVENAELAIILSYGIGDPQSNTYSYNIPIFGKTGISSSSTYGTASVYGNTASYSGTTTYTPTYGIKGFVPKTGSYTTYFRYALIAAYDLPAYLESQKEIQIWKTTVGSTGSSGDLRRVFPILISASIPYLGANSGSQVPVTLYETDDIVKTVKGIPVDVKTDKP